MIQSAPRFLLCLGVSLAFVLPGGEVSARDASSAKGSGASKGSFLGRLVERFGKAAAEPSDSLRPVSGAAVASKAGVARSEAPELRTVVRAGSGKEAVEAGRGSENGNKGDLKSLVGGILQRMGPMDLERTDEAVVNGSGDSLRWLAHPNVAPVVPVAAQPLPFGLSGEVPVAPKVAAPGPEAQLLLGKAADKLERWGASEPAPAPGTPVSGQGTALSREEIETRALLAVAKQREAEDDAGHLAERVPAESRLAPLGLLAGITEATAEVGPEEGAANNPRAGRRELRGLLEVDLQLIDLLPPARELKPALERVRPLVLLQPDSLASRP